MQCEFQCWSDLINMGGMGGYVWSAYGLMFVGFLIGAISPWRKNRQLLKSLKYERKA